MSVTTEQPRRLTSDEKKAAEAAFRGAPFHPGWSESARKVYEGLLLAMARRRAKKSNEIGVEGN